jgi:hypothetical protein
LNKLLEDFSQIVTNDGTETAQEQGLSLFPNRATSGEISFEASDYDLLDDYNLRINYFDENDGEAQLQVLVNGTVVDELLLDENTPSGFPTEGTRRESTIQLEDITSTDIITIRGIADRDPRGSEWARIDYITFEQDIASNVSDADFI